MFLHNLLLLSQCFSGKLFFGWHKAHLFLLFLHLFGRWLVVHNSQAYISSFEGSNIVGSISCHQSHVAFLVKLCDNDGFLIWRSSTEHVNVSDVLSTMIHLKYFVQLVSTYA